MNVCVAEGNDDGAVIEFKSEQRYKAWLQRMGNTIRILNVSTTKQWSLWTGFLGDKKNLYRNI